LCADLAAKRVHRNVVNEGLDAVDLDHGELLPVPLLELGIPGYVHLAQLEFQLGAQLVERLPGPFAQVATGRVIEDDVYYGYSPRVVVASATRWTARP
jgi:hypothetical protein